MKLLRFGSIGQERPGILLSNGDIIDCSDFTNDWNEDFFTNNSLEALEIWLETHAETAPKVDPSVRLGSCVARPSKLVCVGLNFVDHCKESGLPIPEEPVLFSKATSAVVGPNDDVIIPPGAEAVDWEVELAVIIGKRASYVSEQEAMNYVAGYCLHNDYSERDYQIKRGNQWFNGKSCDTFAPLGPWMVTKDEIADINNCHMWLNVNGECLQDSNSSNFVFNIPQVIAYISRFMSLLPGDVISTGTPPGVGLGFNPPRYLKAGDHVELGIEGLGTSQQNVLSYKG